MKYKGVQGGTKGGVPLCRTCRYANYIQGTSEGQTILHCGAMESELPFEAVECRSYDDKRLPSIHEMRKVAWILRSERGRAIGFVTASEWKREWRKKDTGNDYEE